MELCDVGVIGLGVMGRNLARNFARQGQKVAGYDLDPEAGPRLVAAEPSGDFAIAADAKAFVASLERPRRILLMVNAGKANVNSRGDVGHHRGRQALEKKMGDETWGSVFFIKKSIA